MTDDRQTPLQCRIDEWFVARGVPSLAEGSVAKRLPDLVAPLLVVMAVQLAAGPVLPLKTWEIAVGPAVVTLLALPLLAVVAAMLDPGRDIGDAELKRLMLRVPRLLLVVAVVAPLLPAKGLNLALNLLVLLFALFTFRLLLHADVWTCDVSAPRLRGQLPLLVVGAVVLFALAHLPVGPLDSRPDAALNGLALQTLLAVPVALGVWLVAWRLAKRMSDRGGHPKLERDQGSALMRTTPALVLLFGVETTILPSAVPPWPAAVMPLAMLAIVLAVSMIRQLRQAARWAASRRVEVPRREALSFVIPLFMLAYPIEAALIGQEHFFVAAGINTVYLVLAILGVYFGLDRVLAWAVVKVRDRWIDLLSGLLRGLPLFLVFTAFSIMTTELWQAADRVGSAQYIALLGSLLGLTALFLLISSLREIDRHREFDNWGQVTQAAKRVTGSRARDRLTVEPAIDDLLRAGEPGLKKASRGHGEVELRLTVGQRVNLLALLAAYQAMVFLPVLIAAFAAFLGIGRLAITNDMVNNWVHGDAARPSDYEDFLAQPFLHQPWTLIAAFLAVFSVLYFAVYVLSQQEPRREFFAGAEEGVRQRLAVRLLYERQLPHWQHAAVQRSVTSAVSS